MEAMVTGGGYVTAGGYGLLSDGRPVALGAGDPVVPKGREVFDSPPSRYGRFDAYTKMGLAAAGLALRDAGLATFRGKRPVGMVTSSAAETLETDVAYYASTLEEGGAFTSPNLFSYTLPGIVQGECAVLFQMTGPTFCVGDDGCVGRAALVSACAMLASGKVPAMLAGWIESASEGTEGVPSVSGALFVVLENGQRDGAAPRCVLRCADGEIVREDGTVVSSVVDLFGADM